MGSHDNLPVGALPLKNLLPLHESRFSPRYPVVGLGWAPLASLGIAERGKGSLSVCRWFLVPQNRAAVCLSSQFMYLYGYRSTHDVCRGLAGTGAWNSMYCHHACMMQGSRKSEPVTWVTGSSREGVNTEHTGRPGRGSVSQEGGTGPPPLVLLECWYAGGGATDDLHGAYRSANKDPSSLLPPLLHQTPKTPRLPSCFLETPNHSPQQVPRQSHNSKLRYGGGRCSW